MLKVLKDWFAEEKDDLLNDYKKALEVENDIGKHYKHIKDDCQSFETNLCMLRMIPVAIWGHKLDPVSLHAAVKLVVMLTHSHELVIESCYLYCFAIQQLINGSTTAEAYNSTFVESEARARVSGLSTIKYWIENDIEASNEADEMPVPHYRPVSYIKISILWALNYLRNNVTYEVAIKDIISRGGDTRSNAMIVGGLIGAANGFKKEDISTISDLDELLL
jgi:ADP-ribosyl-[dinitrogen reductase] hydrolase